MTKQFFKIPTVAFGFLENKFNSLKKKAKKIGADDIKLSIIARQTDDNNKQYYIVAIEGEPVQFKGYTFLARIDHNIDPTGESNLIYPMPGVDLPEQFYKAPANCEHCGYKRNRKDTFILQKDVDGSYIQVGRTCLKDFFGHDPAAIARRAQYIVKLNDACRDAETCNEAYMTDRRFIDLITYLSYVIQVIDDIGWVSRAEAYANNKVATADAAINDMFSTCPYDSKPTKEQIDKAKKVIDFIKTFDPSKSDFNFNLVQLANLQTIDHKAVGLAAAMVLCYDKHIESLTTQKNSNKDDLKNSQYVGKEKERLDLTVTVLTSKLYNGYYGTYYITRMIDDNGNLFVSFGSFKATANEKVHIRGTVKKHDEYKGIKQTILTRIKVM